MTSRYPIVEYRRLRPWRPWNRRARRRPLVAGRHQVLVHTIDGRYGTGPADPARCAAMTLVDVRPDRPIHVRWNLLARGSELDFPVTVTFLLSVEGPVAVAYSRHTGAPWDVGHVLSQDPRASQLNREYTEEDGGGLRRALLALLESRPAHQEIAGVRVDLGGVSVGRPQYRCGDEA
ncbi:hypothetical protein [Streptomyces sp. NPDC003635]